ncbi:PqqD family protein [Mucilaginibacter sp. AW1-3]
MSNSTPQVFNADTVIQRNESRFLASQLGTETVMMDMDSGDYLGINSVASDMWTLLEAPIKVETLIKTMVELYDVSEEICKAEVETFLPKMFAQNMLIVQEAA